MIQTFVAAKKRIELAIGDIYFFCARECRTVRRTKHVVVCFVG